MTTGPMEFKGPKRRPICFRKAVGFSDSEDLFFVFGDHLILAGKTVEISVKTFCFRRSHHYSAFSPSISNFTKPQIRHI